MGVCWQRVWRECKLECDVGPELMEIQLLQQTKHNEARPRTAFALHYVTPTPQTATRVLPRMGHMQCRC